MKFNITINQPLMIEYNLNISQWCILDVISIAPTWCDAIVKENEVYYWIARQKIAEELQALDLKADTIYRYIKQLAELGFIEHLKDGKKDLIRLSQKGKNIFITMSEKNPNHYVGKKSEFTMSEKNPTYNNTINNYTYIKDKFPFVDEESFKKLNKHLESKYNKVTKVRLTNNIKKLQNHEEMFSYAVDKMIELDYNGLFIPSNKQIADKNKDWNDDYNNSNKEWGE